MFSGSIVALVTPMHADGRLDLDALRNLVAWHIEQGTQGLVVAGTTGESAALSLEEYQTVIREVVKSAAKRIPVIAGSGTNSTQKTIALTQMAKDLGVDACLLLTPYCVRPTQAGLVAHYLAVANNVAIPQILYNVPSRTACDLLPESVVQLAPHPHIVALKECVSANGRYEQLIESVGSQIDILTGDDATTFDLLKVGGKGVISVVANVAPRLVQDLCEAGLQKDWDKALQLKQQLQGLYDNLFVESNPIPVKWALTQMGRIPSGIRLPLTPLSVQYQAPLATALQGIK